VVTVYKVAAVRKMMEGDGISIHSYTNRSNIEAVGKVFEGEDAVE
jgi:hypothetical protein